METTSLDNLLRLKAEWDALQPLSSENHERLWRKLRLEWNFHSNHIEGNTLTYGETEQLFIFGEAQGNHPMREYEEMKAHDTAIVRVRELVSESKPLTQVDIRNLNLIILKEPFWTSAVTPSGESTQKEIVPGRYKIQPNNVKTLTGETFFFVDPIDVSSRMEAYAQLLNASLPTGARLLSHLAVLHHEFLLIHPFDDGNGRVARLVLNYALLKGGYPPIVIRSEEKKDYLRALHQADGEERDYSLLKQLLEKDIIWSLEMGIKAGKGEPIKEVFDIEKEIVLFAHENSKKPDQARTPELTLLLWKKSLRPFFETFLEKLSIFKPLFAQVETTSNFGPADQSSSFLDSCENALGSSPPLTSLTLIVMCERYSGKAKHPFDIQFPLGLNLNKYDFQLQLGGQLFLQQSYLQSIAPSEIDRLVAKALELMFERIKKIAAQK